MPDPPKFDGYSTGAIYRAPDPRNYLMSCIPDVQAQLAVGYPDSDEHLKEHCAHIYDQNGTPACTTHFTAGMMTCNEHIERRGEVLVFDAMGLFNETGAPNVGRYTGDILKRAQDVGVVRVGTTKRYRIGSYAFAPTSSAQDWVDTMKAAVAAGHICGLALLLPSTFGWESSGSIVPNSYHEIAVVGYRPDAFLILNSWSASWGRGGFGWVPISFLVQSGFQNGYVFGNTILDAIDDDLAPNPPNPPEPPQPPQPPQPVVKRYVVTAVATGQGMDTLQKGTPLAASGGGYAGNLAITGVQVYDDTTPPTPGTLTVTGYDPTSVKPGMNFTIIGTGFGSGGNLFVSWRGESLVVHSRSDTALFVRGPASEGTAVVVVRVEASEANGPSLTISAGDTPPDPPEPTPGALRCANRSGVGFGLIVGRRTSMPGHRVAASTANLEFHCRRWGSTAMPGIPATFLRGRKRGRSMPRRRRPVGRRSNHRLK
jgi:hypothetical protein